MSLNPPINSNQTDAKSPLDELLMDSIRQNLIDLDNRLVIASSSDFVFKVVGNLDLLDLANNPDGGRELDVGFISRERTISLIGAYLDEAGAGGVLEFDIKKLRYLGRPIKKISSIFSANTQSIARGSASLATQAINRAENNLDTQLIQYEKASESIDNILKIGVTARYNFSGTSPLDDDYKVGDYIDISGCANALNDGLFQIVAVNADGARNIIVNNPSAVAQNTAGGSVQLLIVEYIFPATVTSQFVIGESVQFTGHTDASNDGTFNIVDKNRAANNIVIKRNTPLVTQGSPAGNALNLRFKYSMLSTISSNFVIGETAVFSGHTTPSNNGNFEVKARDIGGDNLIIYNPAGAIQAAPAGAVDVNRWVYALDSDPAGFFMVGDNANMAGHTTPANNGTFEVLDVKYLGNNNIVIYNAAGVAQAGAAGTVVHSQKAIEFREDFSDDFEIGKSIIEIKGTPNGDNDGFFTVLDRNRIIISPFNVICELPSGILQAGDAGQVYAETRSVFVNGSITMDISNDKTVKTFTVLDGDIIDAEIEPETIILLDILQAPANSANLAINIK
jgi:hypothetical protein